jgi:hypothetical protein
MGKLPVILALSWIPDKHYGILALFVLNKMFF